MENKNNPNKYDKLYFLLSMLLISILAVGMFFFGMFVQNDFHNTSPEVKTQIVYDINDPYSEEKVAIYLKELNVKYIDVAVAQMKLESANGTSDIFRFNNNLFGMKNPKKRATTSLGEKDNHAYYSHWRQSVIDYALWQNFVSNAENLSSESDWIDYIGHMYAEDGKYKLKISKIIAYGRSKK